MAYHSVQWYFFIVWALLIVGNLVASLTRPPRNFILAFVEFVLTAFVFVVVLLIWYSPHGNGPVDDGPEIMTAVLAVRLSAKVGLGEKVLRAIWPNARAHWPATKIEIEQFEDRHAVRVELAERRMAAREEVAKALGLNVTDILEIEQRGNHRRGNWFTRWRER